MAKYIQWYCKQNNIVQECIGGDSVMEVDDRKTINTIVRDIYSMSQYKYRPKNATGFKVCVGTSILNMTAYTKYIPI